MWNLTNKLTIHQVAAVLPKCNPKKTPVEEIVMRVIPNLMSATVVEFSKGTQHTSDNHLSGYFALHRLLIWAIEEYPELQDKIDAKLKVSVEKDQPDGQVYRKSKLKVIVGWVQTEGQCSVRSKWRLV